MGGIRRRTIGVYRSFAGSWISSPRDAICFASSRYFRASSRFAAACIAAWVASGDRTRRTRSFLVSFPCRNSRTASA